MDMETTSRKENLTNLSLTPVLRNFITIRQESFGGYIYNPYLLSHATLTRAEMKVIEYFDGNHTLKDIYQIFRTQNYPEYRLNNVFTETFKKTNRLFAVDWNS
jgi:hypothetical protein